MRLRRKPWVDEAIHDFDDFVFPKDAPANEAQKGNWRSEVFKNDAPLFVELGTGKGDYITQLAQRNPNPIAGHKVNSGQQNYRHHG